MQPADSTTFTKLLSFWLTSPPTPTGKVSLPQHTLLYLRQIKIPEVNPKKKMGPIPEVGKSSSSAGEDKDPVVIEDLCYEPIKSFEELMRYGEKNDDSKSLTELMGECLSLKMPTRETVPCKSKTIPLNKNFSSWKVTTDGKRLKGSECPKTLVCHDFKGGYGDDRFVNGTCNPENYTFRHWLQTDIFVYFSHYFVTIPTLSWINAAHAHGVKILGTLITEWDDGIKLCGEILKDDESIDKTVEKLVLLAKDYEFEGYLINIENELKEPEVTLMQQFIDKLTKSLHDLSQDNLVIWYDAVTIEGKLKWQDSLNELNKPYFDACDGIFLNYNWDDEKLKASFENAKERKFDVFVGVDCFGRGCFGGGGLNMCMAVEKIFSHNLSYAIFAPGWSFESNPYESFWRFDDAMWILCNKCFFFRCLKDEYRPNDRLELLSPTSESGREKFKVFFSTDFSRGYGLKCFAFGTDPIEKPWFDLSRMSFQPNLLITNFSPDDPQWDKLFYDTSTAFSGGGSLRINNARRRNDYESALKCSPIWFPLDIAFSSSRTSIAVLAAWKSQSVDHQLHIYLEVQEGKMTKKLLLGSVDNLAASVAGKYYIKLKLSNFLDEHQGSCVLDKNVEFFFRKNNYDEKDMNGWKISCFLLDLDESQTSKYSGINGLRVGAEGDISLGFLSLAQIIHYDDI